MAKGYRLPCPAKCPESFHNVMLRTWDDEPAARFTCTQVIHNLVQIKTTLAVESAQMRRRVSSDPLETSNPLAESAESAGTSASSPPREAPASPRKVSRRVCCSCCYRFYSFLRDV